MAASPNTTAEMMAAVPVQLRGRIVSGMRWTLWLSALSVPFSFGTTIILARAGPQAIGTFGLLQVYIGLISVFFFLGGNAVAIKFVPELDTEKRLSFLGSYFLVICATLAPWLAVAALWPQKLHYLFGEVGGVVFQVFILYLSPLVIIFSLALAALKGLLEIPWAQILDRAVTIGSFAAYAALFLFARPFLAAHYTGLIWGIYLGLASLVAAVALHRFLWLNNWRAHRQKLRFYLPKGFWRFTLSLQGSSVLGFFSERLDYLFILNVGGLALLGKYVALMTLVYAIPKIATFVLDSLLPSLTNTLSRGDLDSSKSITEIYARIIFPGALAMAGLLSFFVRPVVRLLGPQYAGLEQLILIAAPFAAIQAVNWLIGTVLSASGRPDCNALAMALRVGFFVISFWPLWARFRLPGAILAWGMSELVFHFVSFYLMKWKAAFRFRIFATYWPFITLLALTGTAARIWEGKPLIGSLSLWLGTIIVFFYLAGYTANEIRKLARLILPASGTTLDQACNSVTGP